MSSAFHTQILSDLVRQAELLPHEIRVWKQQTSGNVAGMGIHATQIEAVSLMLDVMVERQQATWVVSRLT